MVQFNCPLTLGLKQTAQGWKLLEGASANDGDLTNVLKKLNKTSYLDSETNKITTAISRLNNSLKESMGLQSNPIIFNSAYKFTFRIMTHELLDGKNITKSPDAMDYLDNEGFDDNQHNYGSYSDDFNEGSF